MELMNCFLVQGRILCTDNWYTSMPLAHNLLKNKTDMIGTLRRNRKGVPQIIRDIKLQKGEVVNKQNLKRVLVLKWKDKKDILMMSIKHDASFPQNGKPMVVVDYNKMKGFVDPSDQIAAYISFVRKTAKWYIRLFFHLLTQTALVNAWFLYSEKVKKIRINYFKELIVGDLLYKDSNNVSTRRSTSRKRKLMSDPNAKARDRRLYTECCKTVSELLEDQLRGTSRRGLRQNVVNVTNIIV
ncbi:hypothetical protein Q1695_006534 [Nippostrongylus brasiliensis]|nr:hypothetical protein Q1695_006534 [Nippostrongylus brasiliensis]